MPDELHHTFFEILSLRSTSRSSIRQFAQKTKIPIDRLNYHNRHNILPSGDDLFKICSVANISELDLMLKMGILNSDIISSIQENAGEISQILKKAENKSEKIKPCPELKKETALGKLYQGDCLDLLQHMENDSVDLIFADPPFNLNKLYPSNIDDNLKSDKYVKWCRQWIDACVKILKPGGSFFIWNLPKWNTILSEYLNHRLTFRHWIAVDIKYTLPIRGRLYPSHYSLLYYCKGEKPNVFHPDRLPMDICPHCVGDLKDYGGYKNKMNPDGVNLTDVWLDIPPVRHKKYKKRNGSNELSVRLMDRIIEMASEKGDLVFDPFGGSGTTYAVAEIKKRKWIGIEIGPVDEIVNRLDNIEQDEKYLKQIRQDINCLITSKDLKKRIETGWWTPESVRKNKQKGKKN